MLNECLKYCAVSDLFSTEIKEALTVLKAKCLFRMYRQTQRLLSMRPVIDADYIRLHDTCYKNAREVIKILGAAFDKGEIDSTDTHSPEYLDTSMMDVCREGKENLKSIKRCILCQKSHVNLQHSHVIPKAVLELFQSCFGDTVGRKAFQVINFPKRKQFDYFSAKQLAYYAFCQDCEGKFNENGEKDFLTFIKGFYDAGDVDCLTRQHTIHYGTWFYYFTMSLLFRSIVACTGIPDHMDSKALYAFFVQCRRFLMGELNIDSPSLPTMYMISNPTKVPEEYHLEIMNQILVTPGFYFCDSISLSDGVFTEPPSVQFILAHIGIMNFLTVFTKDQSVVDTLSSYKVSPDGGVIVIPHESERVLPKGLWKIFSVNSADYRKHMEESFFNKQDKVPVSFQTAETEEKVSRQETFKILEAKCHDVALFAEQSSSAVLNVLPNDFIIVKESSVVSLPAEHHLMLHYSTCEDSEQTTAFIGLCTKKQSVRPFVIHYQTKPSTTFCTGFYLLPNGEVDELMCNTSLEEYPTVQRLLLSVQKSLGTALPVILNSKGFVNLESLIYHFRHRYDVYCNRYTFTLGYNEACDKDKFVS